MFRSKSENYTIDKTIESLEYKPTELEELYDYYIRIRIESTGYVQLDSAYKLLHNQLTKYDYKTNYVPVNRFIELLEKIFSDNVLRPSFQEMLEQEVLLGRIIITRHKITQELQFIIDEQFKKSLQPYGYSYKNYLATIHKNNKLVEIDTREKLKANRATRESNRLNRIAIIISALTAFVTYIQSCSTENKLDKFQSELNQLKVEAKQNNIANPDTFNVKIIPQFNDTAK